MGLMKLTDSEVKCLREVAWIGNASASAIATRIHVAPSNLSRAVASLEDKGFIETKKNGISSVIFLSDAKHAMLWRRLAIEFAHMPLDRLLAGVSLEILSTIIYLNPRTRKEIAEDSVVSPASVAKTLGKLKQFGIIQKTAEYHVSPRFQALADLVIEFRHYLNEKLTTEFASDAVILWERNHEFIVESKRNSEANGFRLTGVSLFARFGIPLLASTSHFFYSPHPKKLRLEDAILHAVLPPQRSMLPVLLVWKKNQEEISLPYIERQAERYGAGSQVKETVRYFETRGTEMAEGFPSWDEFLLRAREYGMT
jgi:DNA-binding MarR family transcriptional regulator